MVDLLRALVVGLGRVLEVAGVLNGHGLSRLGLGAGTLFAGVHGDGHDDCVAIFT